MPRSSYNKVTSFNVGRSKRRSVDDNGKTIGTYSANPIMNFIVYEVEFPDGELKNMPPTSWQKTCLVKWTMKATI
jgi:hypothetical protein